MMRHSNPVLLAAAMFGCTLLFSACEKKDQTPPPSSTDTSQAPSDKSSSPDQSTASPTTGSSTDSGTPQKTDDSNKADKAG